MAGAHNKDCLLFDIICNSASYNDSGDHAKEISESFAIGDGFLRLINKHAPQYSYIFCNSPTTSVAVACKVQVFVLADGKTPFTSACLALQWPLHFTFHSIDPLLSGFNPALLGSKLQEKIKISPVYSQQFTIPEQV